MNDFHLFSFNFTCSKKELLKRSYRALLLEFFSMPFDNINAEINCLISMWIVVSSLNFVQTIQLKMNFREVNERRNERNGTTQFRKDKSFSRHLIPCRHFVLPVLMMTKKVHQKRKKISGKEWKKTFRNIWWTTHKTWQ